MGNPAKIGGQALVGGIVMRTGSSWAMATDDGLVTFGSVSSWLDHHKRFDVFFVRSLVVIFEALVFSLGVLRGGERARRSGMVKALVIYLGLAIPLAVLIDAKGGSSYLVHWMFQLVAAAVGLAVICRGMPREVWGFHGAEHKAVNAYEQGVDLDDIHGVMRCSRVHRRCGGNLAVIVLLATAVYLPVRDAPWAVLASAAYGLAALGLSVELFRFVTRSPGSAVSRPVLWLGSQLQKRFTTAEPTEAQVRVAVRALKTVLVVDDMRRRKAGTLSPTVGSVEA